MRPAPVIVNRREKRIEGLDEPDCRHGAGSSTHPVLEKKTFLTAGTASRRGTRLSSFLEMLQATFPPIRRARAAHRPHAFADPRAPASVDRHSGRARPRLPAPLRAPSPRRRRHAFRLPVARRSRPLHASRPVRTSSPTRPRYPGARSGAWTGRIRVGHPAGVPGAARDPARARSLRRCHRARAGCTAGPGGRAERGRGEARAPGEGARAVPQPFGAHP